jgi:PAS domain S-box-containing protein
MQPRKNSKDKDNERPSPHSAHSACFGVWDWNIETGELVWSPECLEMFGLPLDCKMNYERFIEAIHPEDRERVDQAVKVALDTGNHYSTEMRSVWADGSVHWIASRGRAYYNKSGIPIRMSGAGFDITRLKETEEELRRARAEAKAYAENLATVVDAIPAITFFSRDREGRTMTAGRVAREVFGLPEDVNVSLSDPEVRERFRFQWLEDGRFLTPEELPVQQAASTGKAVGGRKFEVRFPDGRRVYLLGHAVPLLDASGQSRGAVGAFLDVSEMENKEAELRAARAEAKAQAENLSAILDAMPAAAFIAQDRQCEKIVSNKAAYELMRMQYGANTSMSAPANQRPNVVILENGRELAADELPLQKAAASGEAVRNKELEIRFADGSSIFEFGHAVPLFDEAGDVRGAIGAYLDITDRKVMEERLRAVNERFQVALRNTPITVFNQDLDLRYRWIYNPALGRSVAEIIGKRDSELFERTEDAVRLEAIKSEVLRTGVPYQGEVDIYRLGKASTFHLTIEPQRDAQNRICGLTCAAFDLTESKREAAEREKLARQRQLALDAVHMGWWHYDPATRMGIWDDVFRDIFGISALSGPSDDILRLIHPDDLQMVRTKLGAALDPADPKAYITEYRIVRPDGRERWLEAYGAAEFAGHGDTRHAVAASGTVRDITERKEIEEQLRITTERFKTALRGTPMTVLNQDTDLRFTWVYNPVGPHEGTQIVGRTDSDLLEPEDAAWSMEIKREVLRTGQPYQGEFVVRLAGKRRHYHVNIDPQRNGKGEIIGVTCSSFDMTDLKIAQAEIGKLARQRQLALDAAKMGWWRYDAKTKVSHWDNAFKRIIGLSINSGSPEVVMERMHPEDRETARAKFWSVVESGDTKPYWNEYRIVRPDGSVRWIESHGTTEIEGKEEARRLVAFSGTIQDITARKEVESALRASEERYRELAASLEQQVQARTHELREQSEELMRTSEELRILSGRLLQVQDEERRRIARDLHDSSGQILTAIGLDLANIAESAKSEKVRAVSPALPAQVEESQKLVDLLHRELRTTTYLLHPPLLDETGLYSAISWYVQGMTQRSGLNIEFEFAQDFGRLSREMELLVFRLVQESMTNIHRHSGSKTAGIRIRRVAEAITVEVEDRGRGIPPEKLAEIESGVSGLGIRAMRERLRQFGGELKIHSNGTGTRVFVTIPLVQTSQSASGIEPVEAAI